MILLGNNVPGDEISEERRWLRREIIESQKTRAEFLKWKLISTAAVASISFGFSSVSKDASAGARLLLCLVPVLCLYVDLISVHVMIRVVVIGSYLRMHGSRYDKFVFSVRDRSFETVAMFGSSLIPNIAIMALGVTMPAGYLYTYFVAGSLGAAVTLVLWKTFVHRARQVIRLAEEFKLLNECEDIERK